MRFSKFLPFAASVSATAILADLVSSNPGLMRRDAVQGWSLQSGSSPIDVHSCGMGSYCPISLHCNAMVNNHQVPACCSGSSDCRGEVENAPKCADDAWSLWVGYDGNGFCCESGLIGVYDITKSVAGTCVSSDNVGNQRSAVLTSTGTASAIAAPTPQPTSGSSINAKSDITTVSSQVTTKAVATGPSPTTTTATSTTSSTAIASTTKTSSADGHKIGLNLVGVAIIAALAV